MSWSGQSSEQTSEQNKPRINLDLHGNKLHITCNFFWFDAYDVVFGEILKIYFYWICQYNKKVVLN